MAAQIAQTLRPSPRTPDVEPLTRSLDRCDQLGVRCDGVAGVGPAADLGVTDGALNEVRLAPTVLVCGAYVMDRQRFHPLVTDLPEILRLEAAVADGHEAVSGVLELLDSELSSRRGGTETVVSALLDVLLVYLFRRSLDDWERTIPINGWAAALRDPVVGVALDALHVEPQRRWSLDVLARLSGCSRAVFAHRFKNLVGQPPLGYLRWWRLTSAARLLEEDDASVAAVARSVGYSSEYAFSKAFRRQFGVAPGQYRVRTDRPATLARS